MVAGYFASDSILYTVPTGLIGVPMNAVQAVLGAVIAFPIVVQLKDRVKARFS